VSRNTVAVRLIFPHQLFADNLQASKATIMVLVEDDLFFKQYHFHKQKLLLHRISMRHLADKLGAAGYQIQTIETSSTDSMDELKRLLRKLQPTELSYYDVVDDWLQQRLDTLITELNLHVQRIPSPGFLTSRGQINDYFATNPNRMQYFYEWQRKRLNILMDGAKPVGGKWSYDTANRKKLSKQITVPAAYPATKSAYLREAEQWVRQSFADNPGSMADFRYPVSHEQAEDWLEHFIGERLSQFGPYEDAISQNEGQVFHSVLSSSLNVGLLTPEQVTAAVLNHAKHHDVPIESLEGFIRQVIGWREYMRATYLQYGGKMRTKNHLQFDRRLSKDWWTATVGIMPIDTVIARVLNTAYAHHIERLMVLGNSMLLLRINPDDVYEWFMSLFIDAYDWVMVPNVYAMSQFAAGELITTKPYISGSNYILKMSNFKKDTWTDVWDALYWEFIADYRQTIEQNYRSRMVVHVYDGMSDDKKKRLNKIAKQWLE
jgi:deoxyribodipyrimidine photolyase-related protein